MKIHVNGGESRRAFLKGVAMTGAVSMISAASAKGQNNGPGGQSTPLVPTAPPEKGGVAEFQAPQRAMGRTGLQVSILGVGGFHLGAVAGQPEVNDMIAKALDHGIKDFNLSEHVQSRPATKFGKRKITEEERDERE